MSVRWGWTAAIGAGAVWLLVCAQQAYAHGVTQENEKEIVLGLTWMDSAKFLVIPFGLLMATMGALRARRGRPGSLGRAGFAVTSSALALLIVSVALEFWTFPWGSYAQGSTSRFPSTVASFRQWRVSCSQSEPFCSRSISAVTACCRSGSDSFSSRGQPRPSTSPPSFRCPECLARTRCRHLAEESVRPRRLIGLENARPVAEDVGRSSPAMPPRSPS
jgi:hypothetical protein